MHIDRHSGVVRFPSGLSIDSALTQDDVRTNPSFADECRVDCGAPPWIHFSFSGGRIENKELLVSLCFHDQLLVEVRIEGDLHPPGPRDWSRYSLNVEAATKHFHEVLLQQMLGTPSQGCSLISGALPELDLTLQRPVSWKFHWGKVLSCHDTKGGGTFILVRYGDRHEELSRAHRSNP